MEKQIFWITSYPKSGNTLLRYMLIALFFTNDGKFKFDISKYISQFDQAIIVKKNKKVFGEDYNKIGNINTFYKYIVKLQSKEILGFKNDFIFLKTHAGLFKIDDNPFTTIHNTRGFIYIVRDPRDVCISNAKHNGMSYDESIKMMLNDSAYIEWIQKKEDIEFLSNKLVPKSLMSSWEKHFLSWTLVDWKIPFLVLRYEDLVYEKKETLKKIILFFEKNYNFSFKNAEQKISNIIKTTEFNVFKKYEENKGFAEASVNSKFFSVGQKDQWRKKLSINQIKTIENKFKKTMKSLKYKLSVEV